MASDVIDAVGYALGGVEQIPLGEGRNFEVAGQTIAVFRTRADELFASQAYCPHKQGPLADGMLGGSVIVCPLHDRAYDLTSGAEIGGACGLETYQVRRDAAGSIVVMLPG